MAVLPFQRLESMAQEPGPASPARESEIDEHLRAARKSEIDECVRALRCGNDNQKERAAGELVFLVSPGRSNAVVVEAGAVAPLVDIARSGSADAKSQAVLVLKTLACDSQLVLVRAGCIEPLVELMRNGRVQSVSINAGWSWENDRVNAGQALLNLLPWQSCTQTQDAIRAAGDIPRLVELAGVFSGDTAPGESLQLAHPAVKALYHLARDNDENQVAIALAEGGVVALVKLARTGIFWGPGATLHDCWLARPGAKAKAAWMLAERRAVIVHKCAGAVLPPEMGNSIAAFL